MSALRDFGDCLSTREARLLDLPPEFPMPADSIAWARLRVSRRITTRPSRVRRYSR